MKTSTLFLSAVLLSVASAAHATWQVEYRSTEIQETPLALLTGYIKPKTPPAKTAYVQMDVPADLPWSFDWRDMPGGLTPIKNQRGCGSCWAFGTTAALEEAIKIRTGKEVILSEQEIVSCSRYGSCGGGNFAHGYQSNPGQSLASEFPYTASDQRCKSGLSHEFKIKRWGYVGSNSRPPRSIRSRPRSTSTARSR